MAVGAVSQRVAPLTNFVCGRSQLGGGGSVAVSMKEITDDSLVFLSGDDANVDGSLQCVITTGTGFTIQSSNAGDTGFVAWLVILRPGTS